ncbi:MAG: hypothetical protein Q4A18_07670 [Rikenellaceae bacterium]|nr:hypothetical protein [Rikenellaceae bacterium]
MRRFGIIATALLLLLACSKDEEVLPEQQKKMVQYLTSTHQPRLVAESDVEAGTEQPFYTTHGETVYRYIDGYYNPDRATRQEVTANSKVTITFRAYLFNFQNIQTDGNRLTMPFYTNDPLLEEAFYSENVGLTPGAWVFEPLVIDLGKDKVLEGLRLALIGCREQDSVESYMTFTMAYGDDHYMNYIAKESPIAYFFTVDNVE